MRSASVGARFLGSSDVGHSRSIASETRESSSRSCEILSDDLRRRRTWHRLFRFVIFEKSFVSVFFFLEVL